MAAAAANLTATAQLAEATVVLDIGSLTTKAGFAASIPSDDEPRVVTPSCVHVLPTALGAANAANGSNGNQLSQQQLQQYPLRKAFDSGRLADTDALESILHYVLYELVGWQPGREGPLVLVEPGSGLPRRDREALVQLLFEVFSVTHLYSVDALAASTYAHGRLTSTVLDLGHGRADVGAVVDGTTQLASATRLPPGRSGAALDAALKELLERAARGDGGNGDKRGPAPMVVGGGGEGGGEAPPPPLSGADAVAAATDERVRALKERCSRAKASADEFDGRCGFFAAGAVGAQREWWRQSSVVLTPPPPGWAEEQERKRREAEEAEAEAARKKEREEEEAAEKAAAEKEKEGGGRGGKEQQQAQQQKKKKKKETAEDVDDEPPDVLDPLEPHTYTLPDGASITVEPRLGAALGESLFRPRSLAEVLALPAVASAAAAAWGGGDGGGTLAEAVVAVAAQHPDPPTRRALLESILPVGGVAVTPGLASRLEAEVRRRGAPLPSARVACPPPPPYWGARSRALRFAPWLGGAVLARVLPGQERLVHKGDYEEGGPAAVARKFLG
jgi:hypothetical protein